MNILGANASARVLGVDKLPGKVNYFIGNDPKRWHTNVPTYAKVKYEGVYPGVGLVYYGKQNAQLEYDLSLLRALT
jgi:effector-binding domain-containing protein